MKNVFKSLDIFTTFVLDNNIKDYKSLLQYDIKTNNYIYDHIEVYYNILKNNNLNQTKESVIDFMNNSNVHHSSYIIENSEYNNNNDLLSDLRYNTESMNEFYVFMFDIKTTIELYDYYNHYYVEIIY